MKKPKLVRLIVVLMTLAIGCSLTAYAAETLSTGADVMLVIDDTVSMKRNDPNRIATAALQRFAALVPSDGGTRVGMATYSSKILTEQPIAAVNNSNVDSIRDYADKGLTQDGHYTDLPTALKYAVDKLKGLPAGDNQQAIIAVSDGENDFANDDDRQRSEKNLQEVLAAGIPVHIIAINASNKSSVNSYLQSIADATGGSLNIVKSGDEVANVLDGITNTLFNYEIDQKNHFESEVGADPVDWNFNLQDGVFEANLQLTHSEELDLSLFGPDGMNIPMDEASGIVSYDTPTSDGLLTTIKMLEPMEGQYNLRMLSKGNVQYVLGEIVLNNEIYIEVSLSNEHPNKGDDFTVTAMLMRGGEAYTDLAFSNLSAVVSIDGQETEMAANNRGFSADLQAPADGTYDLLVNVAGHTFNRSSDPIKLTVGSGVTGAGGSNFSQTAKKASLPIWLIIVVFAVIVAIIVAVLVFIKSKKGTSIPTFEYVPLPGTMNIVYNDPNHVISWMLVINPKYNFSKRKPKINLGTALRAVANEQEIPSVFDKITIAGIRFSNELFLEVAGDIGTEETPNPINQQMQINTGMESEFDSFDDDLSTTLHFSNGAYAVLTYTLV